MAVSDSSAARFRSAADFPKSVQTLEREQANALYEEMRACLIFTNRSRAQLIRRNTEHKDKALRLKENVSQLQKLINQLQTQKQTQLQEREALIAQLGHEMQEMSTQLNILSEAFEAVGDIEAEAQTHWGQLVFPRRVLRLLQAVKSLMQWWHRQDDSRELTASKSDIVERDVIDEQHRRDYPHQYTDQASINRDLLDR